MNKNEIKLDNYTLTFNITDEDIGIPYDAVEGLIEGLMELKAFMEGKIQLKTAEESMKEWEKWVEEE